MIEFLKRLARSFYNRTIGIVVRVVDHVASGQVDQKDEAVLHTLVAATGFIVLAVLFPQLAILIAILRFKLVMETIQLIVNIIKDTANSYA